jgi:hypothetical protein
MLPILRFTTPTLGTKKKNSFFKKGEGTTSGDQGPMPNQTIFFLSEACLPHLTHSLAHLSAMSICLNTLSQLSLPRGLQGSQKCSHRGHISLSQG